MSNVLTPQNFSFIAGNDTDIYIDIDPDESITLVGATLVWKLYEQEYGLPVADVDPLITKDNGVDGTLVVTDPDLQKIKIPLTVDDTVGLLRNYYHECTVVDEDKGTITVAWGIATALGSENR